MASEERARPGGSQDAGRLPAPDGSDRGSAEHPGRTIEATTSTYAPADGKPILPLPDEPGLDAEFDESGFRIPYSGDAASTRDATFEENPNTGLTAEE